MTPSGIYQQALADLMDEEWETGAQWFDPEIASAAALVYWHLLAAGRNTKAARTPSPHLLFLLALSSPGE